MADVSVSPLRPSEAALWARLRNPWVSPARPTQPTAACLWPAWLPSVQRSLLRRVCASVSSRRVNLNNLPHCVVEKQSCSETQCPFSRVCQGQPSRIGCCAMRVMMVTCSLWWGDWSEESQGASSSSSPPSTHGPPLTGRSSLPRAPGHCAGPAVRTVHPLTRTPVSCHPEDSFLRSYI